MKNKEYSLSIVISIIITLVSGTACLFINYKCALICFAAGALSTMFFIIYTKKRYDSIDELNRYLEMVCAGNFDLDVASNSEGELSILKNNLYKVIMLLRISNEQLASDKIYLADSLADISHQLKTPLTSIMVMTDLISDEEDNAKIKEFSKIIDNQTDRMKWLISTLLKLSKFDAGTVDFKCENISAGTLLDEAVKPFMITLDLKGISLDMQIDDFSLNADRNWTVEAFENIIKNCIEHTDQNGMLKISTNITALYDEVIIEDNGCGIASEDLPHIFERFYHGKNSHSDSVGIGLALAKSIFEKENGRIFVESTEGEGSVFSIKFYKSIV